MSGRATSPDAPGGQMRSSQNTVAPRVHWICIYCIQLSEIKRIGQTHKSDKKRKITKFINKGNPHQTTLIRARRHDSAGVFWVFAEALLSMRKLVLSGC